MNLAFIVTGTRHGRREQWWPVLTREFERVLRFAGPDDTVIVLHGAATGIDTLAGEWFAGQRVTVEPYPASWRPDGPRGPIDYGAGPKRNRVMLERLVALRDEGYTVGVLAFHDSLESSRGTGNMVEIAHLTGIRVRAFTSSSE